MEKNHDNNGRFIAGNKASTGRKKGIVSYIKAKTNNLEEVIDLAYEIMSDPKTNTKDKIRLIEFFMDRALGKPTQSIEANIETPTPIQFVMADLKEKDSV